MVDVYDLVVDGEENSDVQKVDVAKSIVAASIIWVIDDVMTNSIAYSANDKIWRTFFYDSVISIASCNSVTYKSEKRINVPYSVHNSDSNNEANKASTMEILNLSVWSCSRSIDLEAHFNYFASYKVTVKVFEDMV